MNLVERIIQIEKDVLLKLIKGDFEIKKVHEDALILEVDEYTLAWWVLEDVEEDIFTFNHNVGSLRLKKRGVNREVVQNHCIEKGVNEFKEHVKKFVKSVSEDCDVRSEITITKINDSPVMGADELDVNYSLDFGFYKNDGSFSGAVITVFELMDKNGTLEPLIIDYNVYNSEGTNINKSFEFIGGTKELERIIKNYCM